MQHDSAGDECARQHQASGPNIRDSHACPPLLPHPPAEGGSALAVFAMVFDFVPLIFCDRIPYMCGSVCACTWDRHYAIAIRKLMSGSPSYSSDRGLETRCGGSEFLGTRFPHSDRLGAANPSAALFATFGVAHRRNAERHLARSRCREPRRHAGGVRCRKSSHELASGRTVGSCQSVSGQLRR